MRRPAAQRAQAVYLLFHCEQWKEEEGWNKIWQIDMWLFSDVFRMTTDRTVTRLKVKYRYFWFLPEEKSCGLNRCWNLSRILVSIVFWSSQVTRIHPDTGITVALHAANIITKVIIMIICRQKMEVNSSKQQVFQQQCCWLLSSKQTYALHKMLLIRQ